MHVGFRTSGGRGEYELVGQHDGMHASEMAGWGLVWVIPGLGRRDTGLWVDPAMSGKPRLRVRAGRASGQPQIGRQLAALLLFPNPVRTPSSGLPTGRPILRIDGYGIHKIGFSAVTTLDGGAQEIHIRPAYVEVRNSSESAIIGFERRWTRIQAIYQEALQQEALHGPLAEAVTAHRMSLTGASVDGRTIQASQGAYAAGAFLNPDGADVLEVVEKLIGIEPEASPEVPAPGEIAPDDIEGRLWSASEFRLARARGPAARAFSHQVRTVYRHICAFCGLCLPGHPSVLSGVDAAHILAWSEYDLDVVANGICLCKNHHWAFDQAVLSLKFHDHQYVVEATHRIELYNQPTQAEIRKVLGIIPGSRLPADPVNRPSPRYLARLYRDLPLRAE